MHLFCKQGSFAKRSYGVFFYRHVYLKNISNFRRTGIFFPLLQKGKIPLCIDNTKQGCRISSTDPSVGYPKQRRTNRLGMANKNPKNHEQKIYL
jgi:hypothetical protein